MAIPYSKNDRRKKKNYPCSFEGCDKVFDDPGKLLGHEDAHENGTVGQEKEDVKIVQEQPINTKKKNLPYQNDRAGRVVKDNDLGD